jgi:hypothetical protein
MMLADIKINSRRRNKKLQGEKKGIVNKTERNPAVSW